MSNKILSKGFILSIAVAVLLPLSFYLIAKLLSKDKIDLPDYFIVERVDTLNEDGQTSYDTVYHHTKDLVLTNQLGDKVSLNKDLKDKIVLVNFFFTRCPSICPKLTGNLGIIQKAFKKNDTTVQLVSISVDPGRDSVAVLREYADAHNANHDHWWFLTGDRNKIYDFAANELHIVMEPSGGGVDDMIHSEKLVLLDKDRNIRGYYNGLDTMELKQCAEDIVLLTLEKKKHKK